MNPPATVPFSAILQGGVFYQNGLYFEKLNDGVTAVDLVGGATQTFTPDVQVLSFPNASLSLG